MSWLDQQSPTRGTRMDKAVTYIQNRRSYLTTYLEDGRCSFSNNLSENAIRPFTVGRKNWLFCDTPNGAQASVVVYTMIEMAKANGVNVYQYLTYLLEKLPNDRMSDEELDLLSPWNEKVKAEIERASKDDTGSIATQTVLLLRHLLRHLQEDKSAPFFKRHISLHEPGHVLRLSEHRYLKDERIMNVPLYLVGKVDFL